MSRLLELKKGQLYPSIDCWKLAQILYFSIVAEDDKSPDSPKRYASKRTARGNMIRIYGFCALWTCFAASLALGQTPPESSNKKSAERSLWSQMLAPATQVLESKSDPNQFIPQAFKLAQVLAIPLIDATKSISQNIAEASDHLDPFGMKEAQRTIRWQQEVIQAQQKEMLQWQQKEIERLQTELERVSKRTAIDKKSSTKKKRKSKNKKAANGAQPAN